MCMLSCVWLFATPWTVAHQASLSMDFSRQEYWSGLSFLSPGDLPDPGIKPRPPALQADSLPSESPGKPSWCLKVKVLVPQSCPTLCDPMDCSPPGFSIHGIFQAWVLEWVAISFSRGSSRPRDWTRVSCIAGRHSNIWATICIRSFKGSRHEYIPRKGEWDLGLCLTRDQREERNDGGRH